ncbi:MAG: ATP-binding protein [Sandaracinaceae bacterium]
MLVFCPSAPSDVDAALREACERVGFRRAEAPTASTICVLDCRQGVEPISRLVADTAVPRLQLLVLALVARFEDVSLALRADADDALVFSPSVEPLAARLLALGARAERRARLDPASLFATENTTEAVEVLDGQGRINYVNRSFERLFGYSREEAMGRSPAALLRSHAHEPEFYAAAWAELEAGRPWRGQLVSKTKEGALVECDTLASPILDSHGKLHAVVAVRRDVASSRKMEEQLRSSERLAALGTLAAGLAHEINNPLAYVLANLEHSLELIEEGRTPSALRAPLTEAQSGAERVRTILKDMNLLAHDRADEVRTVALDRALAAAARLAAGQLGRVAKLDVRLDEGLFVRGHETRLGQVALNLLINAGQAIPDGDDPSAHRVTLRAFAEGGDAVFEVSDTGLGMTEEVKRRALDPFFTTKPPGRGTGLGLSLCQQIAQSMDGRISLESAPGRGTTVRVTLPRTTSPGSERPSPAAPALRPERLRVLVADDERQVCRAVKRALRQHDVTLASGPRAGMEALELLQEREFDAVICDLTMPEIGGAALREALGDDPVRHRWLFLTGGVLTDADRAYLDAFGGPVLYKPFRTDELRLVVERVARASAAE